MIRMAMGEFEEENGSSQFTRSQKILDASQPLMKAADDMREKFDNFKLEMQQARMVPRHWPNSIHEVDVIESPVVFDPDAAPF